MPENPAWKLRTPRGLPVAGSIDGSKKLSPVAAMDGVSDVPLAIWTIVATSHPPKTAFTNGLEPLNEGRLTTAFATNICGRLISDDPKSRSGLFTSCKANALLVPDESLKPKSALDFEKV